MGSLYDYVIYSGTVASDLVTEQVNAKSFDIHTYRRVVMVS